MKKKLPPPEKTDPFGAISPKAAPERKIKRRPRKHKDGSPILKRSLVKDGGRKARVTLHVPSPELRKTISNMASYGLDVLTISKLAGLSTPTLYKYYDHELKTAAAQKDLMVLQSAFLNAVGGPEQEWQKADTAMQRWWIERRQGWAPPPTRIINERMDLAKLSDEQLDELERILEAATVDAGGDQEGKG